MARGPDNTPAPSNRTPRDSRPTEKLLYDAQKQLPFQAQAVTAFQEKQRKLQKLADAKKASSTGTSGPEHAQAQKEHVSALPATSENTAKREYSY